MKKRIAETVDFFVFVMVGTAVIIAKWVYKAVMCVYRAWVFVFGENFWQSLKKQGNNGD